MITKDKNPTGFLSYKFFDVNNPTQQSNKIKYLWIKRISQENSLEGKNYQSSQTRHFYPRVYAPGNLVVEGLADSQEDYQDLATFIRTHQKFISSTQSQLKQGDNSYLLTLNIPSENLFLKGIVPKFNLKKLGVFDPVPNYNFEFIILANKNKLLNTTTTSQYINKWYDYSLGDAMDVDTSNFTPPPNKNKI
jgi:hypothetical protein